MYINGFEKTYGCDLNQFKGRHEFNSFFIGYEKWLYMSGKYKSCNLKCCPPDFILVGFCKE
jgi:hypothetical protein